MHMYSRVVVGGDIVEFWVVAFGFWIWGLRIPRFGCSSDYRIRAFGLQPYFIEGLGISLSSAADKEINAK